MTTTSIPNGGYITGNSTGATGSVFVSGAGASGTSTITLNSAGSSYVPGNITIGGGGGGAGTYYTATSTTTGWVTPNTSFTNANGKALMTIPYGEDKIVLDEKASLEVRGKVKINGVDLDERLKTIEQVLQIPTRDAIMEAKYPKLKKLYEEYTKELAKLTTWEKLKGDE